MTAEKVLSALKEGNRRFVEDRLVHPRRTPQRRIELADGQHPLASILTCSDSRVVPEILFDQGLGDLFVVRVAGHIVDDTVLGSLEYSAAHLHVPVIVVLGHTKCGAVTAAVSDTAGHDDHTRALVEAIRPAVEMARGDEGNLERNAVYANVRIVADGLKSSTRTLAGLRDREGLRIIGAVYDIDTGAVEWLED